MSRNQYQELMLEAEHWPIGGAKVSLLEEAIRVADTLGDAQLGFEARQALMEVGNRAGYPDQLLVAFSWCLAQADENPQQFSMRELLVHFRSVLHSLYVFPQVSAEQLLAMNDDFQRRLVREGFTPRMAHYTRWYNLMKMGRLADAEPQLALWRKLPRDWFADSVSREWFYQIEFLSMLGRDEEALNLAAAKLKPQAYGDLMIFAILLRSQMRLGRKEEARESHQRGDTQSSDKKWPASVWRLSEHLVYLQHVGDITQATKLARRYLPIAAETSDVENRMKFYFPASCLLRKLHEWGQQHIRLNLPHSFAGFRSSNSYEVEWLANSLREQALELVTAFDRRNGNQYYRHDFDEVERLTRP